MTALLLLIFYATHTNPLTAFLERMLANPNARFGMTSNANLPLPTTTIHNNHPPPPPTTNTPRPLPSMTVTATTTTPATVVVLHKPHHHQTADMACQRFIRACHIDGDSQDAEQDHTAPYFEDHAMKERGKGGKGATRGQGNKGPAATRCAMYTIDGNRAVNRVLSPPPLEPTDPLTQDNCPGPRPSLYLRTPRRGTMTTPPSTNGNDHRR
jgi:hypothetical protein